MMVRMGSPAWNFLSRRDYFLLETVLLLLFVFSSLGRDGGWGGEQRCINDKMRTCPDDMHQHGIHTHTHIRKPTRMHANTHTHTPNDTKLTGANAVSTELSFLGCV
ncbi:unnamed protein product [Boreogadus saida]